MSQAKGCIFTNHHRTTRGFTIVEILIVTVIVGILAAVAIPSWMRFTAVSKLKTAQNRAYWVMRTAQAKAKAEGVTWQASFRTHTVDGEELVQLAVHPASQKPTNASWQNLPNSVQIDDETTLLSKSDIYRVRFNYIGCPVSSPEHPCGQTSIRTKGRITFSSENHNQAKRCVIVSTLLGALRQSKEQPEPDDKGRYCY
mgnify:CR=1 FL=1